MPLYRVRQGHTFGAFNQHTAGAVVELLEHDAAPFFDKLELAEEVSDAPYALGDDSGQPEPAGEGESTPPSEPGGKAPRKRRKDG